MTLTQAIETLAQRHERGWDTLVDDGAHTYDLATLHIDDGVADDLREYRLTADGIARVQSDGTARVVYAIEGGE